MKDTWKMFDKIAPRYDLLNHLLSGYVDSYWRYQMGRQLPKKERLTVLDVATGTGDVGLSLLKHRSGLVSHIVGIDLADNMLAEAKKKLEKLKEKRMVVQKGDAMNIQFPDEMFDVATIAFGIRNVPDAPKAISEMHRVLKKDGRILVLEFSLPRFFLLRWLYLLYFRFILPGLGGLISGDKQAYKYLNTSVEAFSKPKEFLAILSQCGFKKVSYKSLTFGIATLYYGDK